MVAISFALSGVFARESKTTTRSKSTSSSASAKKKKISTSSSRSSRKTAKSSRNAKRPSSVKHFEGFLEGIPDEELPVVEEDLEP